MEGLRGAGYAEDVDRVGLHELELTSIDLSSSREGREQEPIPHYKPDGRRRDIII